MVRLRKQYERQQQGLRVLHGVQIAWGQLNYGMYWGASQPLPHALAGMTSAGNTSFEKSETTFEGPFVSDGDGAFMQSNGGKVSFSSSLQAEMDMYDEDSESSFAVRRLLQTEDGVQTLLRNATSHLVGGEGFRSAGNVSISTGADTTFQVLSVGPSPWTTAPQAE